MAIQRSDPLRDLVDLQDRIKQLFDEALSRSAVTGSVGATAWRPPMDLHEEPERYVLRADIPGVTPEEVGLEVEDGHLVLQGERRVDGSVPRDSFLRVERPYGRFSAQLALPPSVDRSGIRATHRNGVIEILLPKKKEPVPSRIRIDTGSGE